MASIYIRYIVDMAWNMAYGFDYGFEMGLFYYKFEAIFLCFLSKTHIFRYYINTIKN